MIKKYDELIKRLSDLEQFLPSLETEDITLYEANNLKIEKILKELDNYKILLENSLIDKKDSLTPTAQNPNIELKEKNISSYEKILEILLASKDYKEGFKLNELLFKIKSPDLLENVNTNLIRVFEIFKQVGINISIEKFDYTMAVKKYMASFIEELGKPTFNRKMKMVFDEIYWENPTILLDLSSNISLLLNQNDKIFKQYANETLNKVLIQNKLDKNKIFEYYLKEKNDLKLLLETDKYLNVNKFLNNELNIDDYQENSIALDTARKKLMEDDSYNSLTEEQHRYFYVYVHDLYNNLIEYEQYNELEFLIKEIKSIYDKKDSLKGAYETKLKTLDTLNKDKLKLDKALDQICNKLDKMDINKEQEVTKLQDKLYEQEELINKKLIEIRTEEKDIVDVEFQNKILLELKDHSNIYDALELVYYNYNITNYLFSKKYKELSSIEIDKKINEFKIFMTNPNLVITKKMNFINVEPINKLIENKYNLYKFNIIVPELGTPQYQDIKKAVTLIYTYYNLIISKLDLSEIKLMCEVKKMEEKIKKAQ